MRTEVDIHPVPFLRERDGLPSDFETFHLQNAPQKAWIPAAAEVEKALWRGAAISATTLTEGTTDRLLAVASWGFLTEETSAEVLSYTGFTNDLLAARIRLERKVTHPSLDVDAEPFATEAAFRGVHVHLFHFDYAGSPRGEDSIRLRSSLGEAWCAKAFGARVRLLTVQAIGQSYIDQLVDAKFQVLRRSDTNGLPLALMGCTLADAAQSSNVLLLRLLSSPPPQIRMPYKFRRILYHFFHGLSDSAIANKVFLAPTSLKTYWDRIFSQIAEADPEFAMEKDKRQAVRRYLRYHPEEMWPYGH